MAYKVGTTTVIDDSGQIDYARVINAPAASAMTRTVYDVSGTWTKPAGLDANAFVTVELWGGGGGGASGGRNGGGGGGGYNRRVFRAGDLPSSLAVTVGAGGGLNVAGGASSFGTYAYAYGGGFGYYSGGGGGSFGAAGQNGQYSSMTAVLGGGTLTASAGYDGQETSNGWHGGFGYGDTNSLSYAGSSIYGGGGGGYYNKAGGNSVYGAGGGAGRSNYTPGTSVYAGNGGAYAQAGTAPGGGGGAAGVGAAGRVIVYC